MRTHPLFGVLIAAVGAIVLTPDTLFMRLSGMDAFTMLAWRGLLMAAALLVFWLLMAGRQAWAELRTVASMAGLIVIGCQALNAVLFNAGVATAPVSLVLFGVATVPVFSAIAAYIIAGERITIATAITIVLVLLGIGIAVIGHNQEQIALDGRAVFGAFAGLSVAIAFATSFAIIRNNPSLALLPTVCIGALLAGCIGLMLTDPARLFDGEVWAISVSGAVILPLSFMLIVTANRHTHPTNVSLLLLLEAVLGPLWVWWGVGEQMTWPMILGGLIVVLSLGAYLIHLRRISPARPM
ncbi:MAG: DMT family transporter [Pseudomonadota bacterium]